MSDFIYIYNIIKSLPTTLPTTKHQIKTELIRGYCTQTLRFSCNWREWAPYRRAPRRGPWGFSISVLNSFGGNFVRRDLRNGSSIPLYGTRGTHHGPGLLRLIHNRQTGDPGSRAVRLGPWGFSVGGLKSFGGSLVLAHLYSRSNFKLNRAAAFAEWRQLLSA